MSALSFERVPGESEEALQKRIAETIQKELKQLHYNVVELKEMIQDERIVEFPAFFIEELDEPSFLEDFAQYIGMRKIFELHAELKQWEECMRILEMLEKKFPSGCLYFWKLREFVFLETGRQDWSQE